MTTIEDIDRDVFEAYDEECAKLAEVIKPKLPVAGTDDHFNGREWCEEHDISEEAFAYAINHHLTETADWGVSPMYPWRYEEDYLK